MIIQKQNEFASVNGLLNDERIGSKFMALVLNADHGKILNFIIEIVPGRQAIVFSHGLRSVLKRKLQNAMFYAMNAMQRYLVLGKMSFTELSMLINAVADAPNVVLRTRLMLTNGEIIVKRILRVTHVNALWLFSRTWGQYPLAPPIFSNIENFLRGQIASTDEISGRDSCREGRTPSPVFQTKNAKSILVKAIAFVKSLFVMPEFGMEPAASLA